MGRNKHKRGGTERNWKKQEEKIKIKNKKNKKETKQNTPYETQHFNWYIQSIHSLLLIVIEKNNKKIYYDKNIAIQILWYKYFDNIIAVKISR